MSENKKGRSMGVTMIDFLKNRSPETLLQSSDERSALKKPSQFRSRSRNKNIEQGSISHQQEAPTMQNQTQHSVHHTETTNVSPAFVAPQDVQQDVAVENFKLEESTKTKLRITNDIMRQDLDSDVKNMMIAQVWGASGYEAQKNLGESTLHIFVKGVTIVLLIAAGVAIVGLASASVQALFAPAPQPAV